MKPDTVKVLQIDLNKKNLLVINFPTDEYMPHHKNVDADKDIFSPLAEKLQDWIADKDGQPLLCLGLFSGETVTLEKIDTDANTDYLSEIANRINRLEEKVERIMKYIEGGE